MMGNGFALIDAGGEPSVLLPDDGMSRPTGRGKSIGFPPAGQGYDSPAFYVGQTKQTCRVVMAMLRYDDGVVGLAMSTATDKHKYGPVGAFTRC